jgi:hypothetical protein
MASSDRRYPRPWRRASLVAVALFVGAARLTLAQELEPGTYQNAPTGLNVAAASMGVSRGNVLFDAALPVADVRAEVEVLGLGYVRTLAILGRSAKVDAQIPVTWSQFSGIVGGEARTRSPRGLADPRFRLSMNLLGSPALSLPEFAKYRQRAILGVSLQIAPPLGQYDADHYINLGSNRWSFRSEVGVSYAHGRLTLEGTGGAWAFTNNADYVGATTLAQSALYFAKASGIWAFRRGMWLALNYGRATGGQTRVNGVVTNALQRSDRLGATLLVPVTRSMAIRTVYNSGLSTRYGADFDSLAIGGQYTWARRPTATPLGTTTGQSTTGIHHMP